VSNGVYNLTRAVGLAAGLSAPNYLQARFRSFVGAVFAVLVLGALAFVTSYLSTLDDRLAGLSQVVVMLLIIMPLTLALVFGVLVGVYRFAIGPSVPIRGLLRGAVLATIGLAVLHAVLVEVVARFGGDSAVYGVAAGLISGLLATYFAIYIILLGAAVNAILPAGADRSARQLAIPFAMGDA